MIYYTNVPLHVPHMTFIGRWSPFHKGHIAIITKKLREYPNKPVLILIRSSQENYSPVSRAVYIKEWMIDQHINGTIMFVPNIEGVYWGRGVGYTTEYVDVEKELQTISATDIRHRIQEGKSLWKHLVAQKDASYMLSPRISSIFEKGLVIWLTGCPSSGKTTIADAFIARLTYMYPHIKKQILDGDDMRASPLAAHVGFTKQDRADHIRRMAYLAKLFADHGILVVCSFVSPDATVRAEAKEMIGKDRFIEVYVKASKKTRMARDQKGLYKKAHEGKLLNLTGYNAPYEIPKKPALTIQTDRLPLSANVERMVKHLFGYHR